ncbi:MAG: alpha/beta hydrolase [Microbacteriaceae bacterium]|nr:alpha/beta hydrolase [Microbacteriaceae bacterium]
MPHLERSGATLYYEIAGPRSAPGILLLHAGVATLRMWDPVVPTLSDNHFVICVDSRGFGSSTAHDGEFSDRADALALLDELGIDSCTVVGSARGAGIAIDLALESPERVAGLVTIGGGPGGFPVVEPTTVENHLFDRLDVAFLEQDWKALNELEVRLLSIGATRDQSQLNEEFVELAYRLNRANLVHVGQRLQPLPLDPPAWDRLTDITAPTLVTVGDFDLTETLAAFEYLASTIVEADSARFTESAHLPSVEQADDFTALITDWLVRYSL